MNLDDLERFHALDAHDMCSHIDRLPDQLQAAWAQGMDRQKSPLPDSYARIERIVFAGVGASAMAGDLLAALIADSCNIPVIVNRGYDLPAHADGQSTLVIVNSYSGDTEEALSVLELADARGTKILSITTGGALARYAEKSPGTVWRYDYASAPRAALGWSFGLALALVNRLGLVRDLSEDVAEAVRFMRELARIIGAESPVVKNPAKRLAGQMIGRTPVIYGSGILAPVARRWKTQLNENGKTLAGWEELPEMNHNAIAGITFPPPLMTKIAVIFLVSSRLDHPRVALRHELTRKIMLQEGIASDVVKARGESPLAQMMSAIQFGDYVSYYVAMAYGVDPTPIPTITELKEHLTTTR